MTGLAALLLVLGLASAALAMKWYERALDGPLPARALSRTVFAAALVGTAAVLVLSVCDVPSTGPGFRSFMEGTATGGFVMGDLYAYGVVREDRTRRQGQGQAPVRTGRPMASAGEDETKGDNHVQTSGPEE